MNRILIASAAILAFAGVASAQQAPFLAGNYSANVLETYNNDRASDAMAVDFGSTASIGQMPVQQDGLPIGQTDDVRSGR